MIFPAAGNRKKNYNNNYNEKKNGAENLIGLLPRLYCEKDLYCNVGNNIARNKEEGNGIVLQDRCSWLRNCIAIQLVG